MLYFELGPIKKNIYHQQNLLHIHIRVDNKFSKTYFKVHPNQLDPCSMLEREAQHANRQLLIKCFQKWRIYTAYYKPGLRFRMQVYDDPPKIVFLLNTETPLWSGSRFKFKLQNQCNQTICLIGREE